MLVSKMDCEICQISKLDKKFIFETNYWQIILSEDQAYLGRCLVKLKRHSNDLADLTPDEWIDFSQAVNKLELALKKSFNTTAFNWSCLMNDAYRNNPVNPHVHWHFRPRYKYHVEFEGLSFKDELLGYHYAVGTEKKVSEEIANKIIQKIRENLQLNS